MREERREQKRERKKEKKREKRLERTKCQNYFLILDFQVYIFSQKRINIARLVCKNYDGRARTRRFLEDFLSVFFLSQHGISSGCYRIPVESCLTGCYRIPESSGCYRMFQDSRVLSPYRICQDSCKVL